MYSTSLVLLQGAGQEHLSPINPAVVSRGKILPGPRLYHNASMLVSKTACDRSPESTESKGPRELSSPHSIRWRLSCHAGRNNEMADLLAGQEREE